MSPIVHAIDIGYRMTKFTVRVDGAQPTYKFFPSIAPLASDRDHSVGRGTQRNTVIVPVGNLQYEVGPDAFLVSSTFPVRLDESVVEVTNGRSEERRVGKECCR